MCYLQGLSLAEIASHLGVDPSVAWRRLQKPVVQAAIARVQDEEQRKAMGTLKRLSAKAVRTANRVMSDEGASDADALRAAFGILDRAGLGPTQKHEIEHDQVMELVINGERLEMPREPPPAPILTEPDG